MTPGAGCDRELTSTLQEQLFLCAPLNAFCNCESRTEAEPKRAVVQNHRSWYRLYIVSGAVPLQKNDA